MADFDFIGELRDLTPAARKGVALLHDATVADGSLPRRVKQLARSTIVVVKKNDGEHTPEIRTRALRPFAPLGIGVGDDVKSPRRADADIATSDATVRTLVVTRREELVTARATRAFVV